MTDDDLYNNIVQSVVKLCRDFTSEHAPQAGYIDFDAHAQVKEWPEDDTLIGPAGVGMAHEANNTIEVVFSVGVTTKNDENLFRLRGLMSKLYGRLKPESKVVIYDHATAMPTTWMVTATPVAITPVSKAEMRSVQFIEVRALIDPGATSSLR